RSKRDWSSDVCSSDLPEPPPLMIVVDHERDLRGLAVADVPQPLVAADRDHLVAELDDQADSARVVDVGEMFDVAPRHRRVRTERSEERRVGKEYGGRG